MRRTSRVLLALGASAATLAASGAARAQIDINPPLPNVLLLIDTSGSMEMMADGKAPENEAATCKPGTATPLNKWATLASVLTGTINNFSCQSIDRGSGAFLTEYQLPGGVQPYDYKYYLPFHRLLSNNCAPGPGNSLPTWYGWPAGAISYHDYANPAVKCPAPGAPGGFSQAADGILDTFGDRVRFGLMTFDSFPDPSTGATGVTPDYPGGVQGMWSYYLGWNSGGSAVQGNPPLCQSKPFEVGARGPAAPPWEGRLIPFGAYNALPLDVATTNGHIQEAILAMRPYGATPLAGMMDDAYNFLLNDTSLDPATNLAFGPATDPFFGGGCRKTFVILLSDGSPNLDLRPSCSKAGGSCPYRLPYQYAHDLATNPDPSKQILTFAVGFGLSKSGSTDCSTLTQADITAPGGLCATTSDDTLIACCNLGRIAYEGGTTNAYYANDPTSLKAKLAQILQLIAAGSTSRTLPVFSAASSNASTQGNAGAASYQFASSFNAPIGSSMWSGNLDRKRTACSTQNGALTAVPQKVQSNLGDSFAANLNSNDAAHPRQFWTVIGAAGGGGAITSDWSIRPGVSSDDGLGTYTGVVKGLAGGTFPTAVSAYPKAFNVDPTLLPVDCLVRLVATDAPTCVRNLMNWEVGINNPGLAETRNPSGCPAGQTCSMLGAIYHSTPWSVGTPKEYLRDESYATFALAQAARPLVLYTATTDGQLHAFKVATNDPKDADHVDQLENNELWSFFPPAVLPRLLTSYNQQAMLLDGPPIVKDVVFERTQAQSINGGLASGAQWSTVLVAGGGAGGPYYYALDVTSPTAPKFLWQVSKDAKGYSLFGSQSGTPAIATIALNEGTGVKEVAVAILPGGPAPLLPGGCPRQQASWPDVDTTGTFKARTSVRCWGNAGGPVGSSRSLTIVRLDTGKVLMNFRGASGDGPPGLTTNQKVVLFDSPLTGVPVPYPSSGGQVANRVYIGDADGTLWRVDLSDPMPANWSVSMAWDGYGVSGDTATSGQPIQTPPIVSVDPSGNGVVLFSTGDQEQFSTVGAITTRVWSILDKPNGTKFQTTANWYQSFNNGKRVTGPISLFNGVAYFSTFTPQSGGACSDGFGSVWGVDYLQNDGGVTKPLARLVPDLNQPNVIVPFVDQAPSTVVFGVAVTQTPTCSNTTSYTDAYLGSHTAVSDVSTGAFQLVFQTGKGGAASADGSSTRTTTIALPSPRKTTRIDSWASIVE